MSRVCTECGKEIADGLDFCVSCGANATEEKNVDVAASQRDANIMEAFEDEQRIHTQGERFLPQTTKGVPTGKWAPVSTSAFFGLHLLFSIPVIGWIACLIMAFVPKKQNLKNYARAMLIWCLVGALVLAGLYFAVQWVGGLVTDFYNDMLGQLSSEVPGGTVEIGDLLNGLVGELDGAELSGAIDLEDLLGNLLKGLGAEALPGNVNVEDLEGLTGALTEEIGKMPTQ